MSKSYNNTIEIFDDPAVIRKKVKRIKTDSKSVEEPKDPDTCPLFALFKLVAQPHELADVEPKYRNGGIGYGEMKDRLADAIIATFADARERRAHWAEHPVRVAEVRAEAAERARASARIVLAKARAACGLG
jgi:tryptophanyl-tRNA synthetase